MRKKWWGVVFIAIIVGAVAIVLGFLLPEPDSFLKNILAEVAGLAFALALAVWLIEGPLLTRERRLRKVISIAARSVAQLNEEIALMVVRDVGEYLAGRLEPPLDLYGEERGDWGAFKLFVTAGLSTCQTSTSRRLTREQCSQRGRLPELPEGGT